jgi:hypothetical protein
MSFFLVALLLPREYHSVVMLKLGHPMGVRATWA